MYRWFEVIDSYELENESKKRRFFYSILIGFERTNLSNGLIGLEMNNMLIGIQYDERITARIKFV